MSLLLPVYRGAARLAAPALRFHLRRRAARGKEDPARLGERFGRAGLARPGGKLLWVHAASVGESLSALPLLAEMKARYAPLTVLMTTGTVTSARLIAARAPDVLHQFVPVDTPRAVRGFLSHWCPDMALWMESELWPSLVTRTAARGIPLTLVNGRISEASARNWRWAPGLARALIGAFDLRLAQTEAVRERLFALGAPPEKTIATGDLKASRPAEIPDPAAFAAMQTAIGGRPVWLAASTHPGEEEAVAAAHEALAARAPDLLTILVPRHPERGAEIAAMLSGRGLRVSCRSEGADPAAIYIADTLGEMPLWAAVAPIVYIGAGWGNLGGHNPLEFAQSGTAILSGPRVANFRDTYAQLEAAGAVRFVADEAALCRALLDLTEPGGRPGPEAQHMAESAEEAGAPDPEPLRRSMDALAPLAERALQ